MSTSRLPTVKPAAAGGYQQATQPESKVGSKSPPRSPTPPQGLASLLRADADGHAWLEHDSERTAAWTQQRNATTLAELETAPSYSQTVANITQIQTSQDRISGIAARGEYFCNFWTDEANPRGYVRRVPIHPSNPFEEYIKPDAKWETVVSIDALNKKENKNWVWKGATWLEPECNRCIVALSDGGSDAVVLREFDADKKEFLIGKNSFNVEDSAKSSISWIDRDTVFVKTNFGPGSLTKSNYPRIIKRWERGQVLADAKTIFKAGQKDISVFAYTNKTATFERTVVGYHPDFYLSESFLLQKDDSLQKIHVPRDAGLSFWRDQLLLKLRSNLKEGEINYPVGTLIVTSADAFLEGKGKHRWQILFKPTASSTLSSYTFIDANRILLNGIDNVASFLREGTRSADGHWALRDVRTPPLGDIGVHSLYNSYKKSDDPLRNKYLMYFESFTEPMSLSSGTGGTDQRELLATHRAEFDSAKIEVCQNFAVSTDGIKIPYFLIKRKDCPMDGTTPTLLGGYGGFRAVLKPGYMAIMGKEWIEPGAGRAYVIANIRGGGEFGPAWHKAGSGENKQKSFDDFIAVAIDLCRLKITSPEHLGITGGSNGGLLVGAAMVQRPDLFKAVVCSQPLLDMKNYTKWLSGHSWIAEYGDPKKPEDWKYMSKYSPYHHVPANTIKMPRIFIKTASGDDRVHPAHARKMTAALEENSHDVLFLERKEGGHSGSADHTGGAKNSALELVFMAKELGGTD
jgi:prolyl oligopeptidase